MLDGIPMKIFCDGLIKSADIYGKQITFYGADGSSFELSPTLTRPSSLHSLGIFGALDFQDLRLTRCRKDKLRPQYLFLRFDGASVNESLTRYVCSETSSGPNLLVLSVVCMDHSIRNSALWPLGNFMFGQFYVWVAHRRNN